MGGPPWPPLFTQGHAFEEGAAKEGRPYKQDDYFA